MVWFFSHPDDADSVKFRLRSCNPINISFSSKDALTKQISIIRSTLDSLVAKCGRIAISIHSPDVVKSEFTKLLHSMSSTSELPDVYLSFDYDLGAGGGTPTFQLTHLNHQLTRLRIHIDVLCCIPQTDMCAELHAAIRRILDGFLVQYEYAVDRYWELYDEAPKQIHPYNYRTGSHLVTIFYPNKICEKSERNFRLKLHQELGLSTDSPVFRRGQALLTVPLLSRWLGPSDKLLVCPHEHLKPPPGQGTVHVVSGRYTYKHYLQDEVDDKGWGCAYRSLQTLISWLMWQGEVEAKRIPTLTEIQTSLVRLGDKSKAFIGSHQWIGSVEVSFCLQEMYNIQCRLLPVSRGAELSRTATTMLAHHFASGGGPVMIGGGQLAHTIIGVQIPKEPVLNSPNSKASTPRFLILDPHFTGPSGDLKVVLAKGWCGWKDQSFWRQDTYYNLCFLPAIQPGCV